VLVSVVRTASSLSSPLGLATDVVDKAIAAANKLREEATALHHQHTAANEQAQAYADLAKWEVEVAAYTCAFDAAITGHLRSTGLVLWVSM
jgi:hypothetical protein